MSFLSGRVSFLRFRVDGPKPLVFTGEHLGRLEEFKSGRQKIASADGIDCGWTAGAHNLDVAFEPAKNIVYDALCVELCLEFDKLPADKLKAYYEVDLKALAAQNPTGLPNAKQKREAKESARDRLEDEAKDGRYRKRKCMPMLWDAISNEVLFGVTSYAHVDRLVSLFQQTFGFFLVPVTASNCVRATDKMVYADAAPTAFVPAASADVAWIADESSRDFLGNEFILWMWYFSDTTSDTLKLSDGSDVTFMLSKSLVLDCPRGETGRNTLRHENPTRLPEAKRAVQSGKLPRKSGLIVVRNDEQYEFAIQAENLSIGSAKLPKPPDDVVQARAKLEERIRMIRDLVNTVDLMCEDFLRVRLSPSWTEFAGKMNEWLMAPIK